MKKNINIANCTAIKNWFLFIIFKKNKNLLTKKTNDILIYLCFCKNYEKKRNIKFLKKWLKNYLLQLKQRMLIYLELIGGAEGPAKKLVFEALKNKKHVITANKALIAKYGDQLS